MPRLTPDQRLARAQQAKARAEETIRRTTSVMRESDRRDDTRRKIILGGALIEAAKTSPNVAQYLAAVVSRLTRPADRAAFEGWDAPAPRPVASPSPSRD